MDNILEIRDLSKTYYTKEEEVLAIDKNMKAVEQKR